jgi:hypothetical protein
MATQEGNRHRCPRLPLPGIRGRLLFLFPEMLTVVGNARHAHLSLRIDWRAALWEICGTTKAKEKI